MAAQPSTAESAGEPCVGTPLGQGSAGPAGGDSAAVEALPAAKILPEQDRPVLLTPRTPREDAGGSAPGSVGKRVRDRASSRLRRHMPGKGGGALADAATPAERIKPNPQVESLFSELSKAIPCGFMTQDFSNAAEASTDKSVHSAANLSPEQLELVKSDAERHASLITSLSKAISDFTAPDMTTLVEYVRDTSARLGVIMANEAAVLEQFPTWPQGKWDSLCEAGEAYSELSQYARKEKQWLLQRGTCDEEVQKIEAFVDRVRSRTQLLEAKQGASEAHWQLQGIPWDGSVYRAVRVNSLHLATLYMSRVLFEVASLEKEAALPHQACLRHLAASIRVCHKIHDLAGGFEQGQSELFDKVRRLAKYYLRVMDASWFSETDQQ
ncbi:hypothetical protein COCSUDRAFT_53920 [Coccomyxa subellipsoidea C-169]|uniref:Uncharacterized protein n=1 Tax=Coccomyxa subellipsoidea (strain C-169) TaxID=574566 RepID=I0YUB9_COCSC|nr:hypothetical protein COCSUDRAFT_53920 [Coccomyxa subellipsoidea C-169]EIE21988.1 hypothetical protein COCSUDRAFT_53920 [Coccomyxa subellipsoidea C-169]|eukprot:XP_005646532.1 hypothetical protein COCSUDRAFT_53920 [Coccomyxa subellipsoidea C-169]